MESIVLPALLRVTNRGCVVDIRSVFALPRSTIVILSEAAEKDARIGKPKLSRGGVEVLRKERSGWSKTAAGGISSELDVPFQG